ncbi:ketopantoate reductase family protein [Nocardiopsis trehalosi]|uniref:ketopantoate reductase family protein n=1 Tax=Nocardiopsis trehalosi TaxID=109329 RepID=UPI00082C24DB|nr:2-dehydropantoate 2-reductase [Nocardiopsis trehalosi]
MPAHPDAAPAPDPRDPGRITVLAPGGVGGLLAGLLARAGRTVDVVATPDTAARIAADGLRVDSAAYGDFTAAVEAAPRARHRPGVLVVAPKATALDAALDRVPADLVGDALVVPLLNGFEHMAALRARYPDAHVLSAAIRVESTRVAPGHIVHSSPFAGLDVAYSGAPAARVEAFAAAVRAAGLPVELRTDEDAVLWRKLHFLLPMALVCTHAEADVGATRAGRRADLLAVAGEVAAVAAARGVRLDADRFAAAIDSVPAATKPSMLRDREAGRPMEVDALGGALLRAGRAAGVPTPATARIVADLERVRPAG